MLPIQHVPRRPLPVRVFSILSLLVAAAAPAQQDATAAFAAHSIEVDGQVYPYRLLEPPVPLRDIARPLVVFLHGAGERGQDNVRQLEYLPQKLAADIARHPCYVLAVQCPDGERWVDTDWRSAKPMVAATEPTRAMRAVLRLVADLRERPGVDPARVYVTGLSMGGFGAWDLALRRPEWVAALLPLCGGADPHLAHRLLGMPIQVWHGGADPLVPVANSRAMVDALRQLGCAVDYREPADIGHAVWVQAYGDARTIDWLFAQDQRQARRGAFALPAMIPAPESASPPLAGADAPFRLRAGARCHVPEAARPAAQVLLDALERSCHQRPGLIGLGVLHAGDLVFAVEPALPAEFALEIGEVFRIVVRDETVLQAAAAAAWQVLQTEAGGGCPAGRLVRTGGVVSGRVVFGASPVPWPEKMLLATIRTCWSYGVRELVGDGLDRLDWLSDAERLSVRSLSQRHGLQLFGTGVVDAAVRDVAVFESAALAGGPCGLLAADLPNGRPQVFELRLSSLGPDSALAELEILLPAVAERAQRPAQTIHVANFLARLACQLRASRG